MTELVKALRDAYEETDTVYFHHEQGGKRMSELKRCCENCGNIRCASSVVAYWWDECVESNFENHWMPLPEPPEGATTCSD